MVFTCESPISIVMSGLSCSIKVLDLLTNRYHVGVVQVVSHSQIEIELPLSARLNAGQRVQFVLEDAGGGVVSRRTMRTARVCHVTTTDRVRAHLAMTAESLAA
jgi:sulfopyruvate decarboxylase TPP-binding subunit